MNAFSFSAPYKRVLSFFFNFSSSDLLRNLSPIARSDIETTHKHNGAVTKQYKVDRKTLLHPVAFVLVCARQISISLRAYYEHAPIQAAERRCEYVHTLSALHVWMDYIFSLRSSLSWCSSRATISKGLKSKTSFDTNSKRNPLKSDGLM